MPGLTLESELQLIEQKIDSVVHQLRLHRQRINDFITFGTEFQQRTIILIQLTNQLQRLKLRREDLKRLTEHYDLDEIIYFNNNQNDLIHQIDPSI